MFQTYYLSNNNEDITVYCSFIQFYGFEIASYVSQKVTSNLSKNSSTLYETKRVRTCNIYFTIL